MNLSDHIRQKDGTSFHLNGFSEAFTLPMIASSVGEYSRQNDSKISEYEGSWISQLLNNTASHDSYEAGYEHFLHELITDPENRNIITIASGYDWHATHLFYWRGFLIYCNRGAGSGSEPGIQVYRVPDSKRITPDLIKGLIRRHEITTELWNEKYSIGALVLALGLEKVVHLKQKNQKTGNCTYITTKCAVRALLAIGALAEQYGNGLLPNDKGIWIKAFDQTRDKYKHWGLFDKNLVVNDLLKDRVYLDRWEDKMISQTEFRKIFRMVKEKVLAKRDHFPEAAQTLTGLQQI
jgi:hypothetical protein